jgi:hypothetical protein
MNLEPRDRLASDVIDLAETPGFKQDQRIGRSPRRVGASHSITLPSASIDLTNAVRSGHPDDTHRDWAGRFRKGPALSVP